MNLIQKSDPQYFELTSEEPYDRHDYKVVMTNGKTIITDNWDTVQMLWFQNPPQFISHVEVLDKENNKTKKSNGGFK